MIGFISKLWCPPALSKSFSFTGGWHAVSHDVYINLKKAGTGKKGPEKYFYPSEP